MHSVHGVYAPCMAIQDCVVLHGLGHSLDDLCVNRCRDLHSFPTNNGLMGMLF